MPEPVLTAVRDVGANAPVTLCGDTAWYVVAGSVDVFLQECAGRPGPRHLFCSAGADMLLWPGTPFRPPTGWQLVAVGRPGTRLARVETPGSGQFDGHVAAFRRLAGVEENASFDGRLAGAVHEAQASESREAQRIAERPARARGRLTAALGDLADVVDRPRRPRAAHDEPMEQLAIALQRIGAELRVEFPDHPPVEGVERDPVAVSVAAAGCRARVVTLRGAWWASAGAPLLGFDASTGRPVALVSGPPGSHRYGVFDPATARTVPVDARTAAGLASTAYAISAPLPSGAMSAKQLLRFGLARRGRDVWLLFGLGTLAGVITLVTPLAVQVVYGSVIPSQNTALLAAISALLFGAAVTWGLVTLSQNIAALRIQGRLQERLDPAIIDRLLRLPSEFFRSYTTGDLATRVNGLAMIRQQLSGPVLTSVLTFMFSIFNIVLLFVYSPLLGAVALAGLIVALGLLVTLNIRLVGKQREQLAVAGELNGQVYQAVQGVQKVRVAGAEERVMARWAKTYRESQRLMVTGGVIQSWTAALTAAVPVFLLIGVYAVAGTLVQIPAGTFLAFTTALGQFTAGVVGLTFSVAPLLLVVPLWRRLLPVLEASPEEAGRQDPGVLSGQIDVVDVEFAYSPDAPPVLRDVTLHIEPGEFVAVTGPSGSGKSTLLRLLLGLDTPGQGSVLYDGKDLALLDAGEVRRQTGVVMQNARPLPGEILSTITGYSSGDEGVAWRAAEAAGLAEDIRRMPMRMRTVVGEGALAFSGGQMQRLMIAKALAQQPRLVLLDEATSALDDRTQAQVTRHLERTGATRVVVAHRLSTIRNADRIYVLDAGQIVQVGKYEELLGVEGPFRRLAERQVV